MNKDDYNSKLNDFLQESNSIKLQRDPANAICHKVKALRKLEALPIELKNAAWLPPGACTPKLFGRLKSHKPGNKLRPIVSKRSSPTYNLEKTLAKFLMRYIPDSNTTLNSTEDFVERIKQVVITDKCIIGSFDVISLYPSVPVTEAIQNIKSFLEISGDFSNESIEAIITALKIVTENNVFNFNGEIYRQTKGAPMGSPVSGTLAEAILRPLENLALEPTGPVPSTWLRYVDDIFFTWPHSPELLAVFFQKINRLHVSLKFTMELEDNGKLPFLDVLLLKEGNVLNRQVYRKPTAHTNVIPACANTPWAYKTAAFRSYFRRANIVCSTEQALVEEMTQIIDLGIRSGFSKRSLINIRDKVKQSMLAPKPKAVDRGKFAGSLVFIPNFSYSVKNLLRKYNIEIAIKPPRTLLDFVRKDREANDPTKSAGVYAIPLLYPDGETRRYIGATKRSLELRRKEHQADVREGRLSTALARDVKREKAVPLWSEMKRLARYTTVRGTAIRETIEILLDSQRCNQDISMKLPPPWLHMLENRANTTRERSTTCESEVKKPVIVTRELVQ